MAEGSGNRSCCPCAQEGF